MGQQPSQCRSRAWWMKQFKIAGLWASSGAGALTAGFFGPSWSAVLPVLGAVIIVWIRKERDIALAKNTKDVVTRAMNNPNCASLSVNPETGEMNYTAKQ